jgi:hypothetical protein
LIGDVLPPLFRDMREEPRVPLKLGIDIAEDVIHIRFVAVGQSAAIVHGECLYLHCIPLRLLLYVQLCG